MKKPWGLIVCISALLAIVLSAAGCTASLQKFEATRSLMDTFVTITVYADDGAKGEAAINAAFDRMTEVESVTSIYEEDSQAFQLNRDGYVDAPAEDLREVISLSQEYSQLTGGAFDITVEPLLELWQNGLWMEPEDIQQSRVNEALGIVGWDKIKIEDNRISFTEPGMKITLGGIAKGYAVDEAMKVIKDMGIKNALVNAGGDIMAMGSKPNGDPWLVALINPDDTTQSLANLDIINKAVTTSGNYVRYFDPEKEAHHIINPKTGYSAQGVISATIITDNATRADALSTSVFVMGPEEGIDLVESLNNVECLIVSEDRQTIYTSSGLSKYLGESGQGG